jgi:hypothetical protein
VLFVSFVVSYKHNFLATFYELIIIDVHTSDLLIRSEFKV